MAMRTVATRVASLMRFQCQLSKRHFSAVPQELKYLESHEWVKVEGETGTIGISDHAQHELGDVVFTELPEVGTQVTKGKQFGVVESVKACSDVYAPVSGQVTEVNHAVKETPALVNKSPFEDGWLIKLKLKDASDLDGLLDDAKYQEHINKH